jgi:hypothetical protein
MCPASYGGDDQADKPGDRSTREHERATDCGTDTNQTQPTVSIVFPWGRAAPVHTPLLHVHTPLVHRCLPGSAIMDEASRLRRFVRRGPQSMVKVWV